MKLLAASMGIWPHLFIMWIRMRLFKLFFILFLGRICLFSEFFISVTLSNSIFNRFVLICMTGQFGVGLGKLIFTFLRSKQRLVTHSVLINL
jgi:hypothetical protein